MFVKIYLVIKYDVSVRDVNGLLEKFVEKKGHVSN